MSHVESNHGSVMLDDIIETSQTETRGAYTAVGTYPCMELVKLISALSEKTRQSVPDIIIGFGKQLAETFKHGFPQYFGEGDYFDFVECVESRIHIDVLKLYPDAELPRFNTISRSDDTLVIDYISSRNLEHLALGLLQGTAEHFGETVSISMVPFMDGETRTVRFEINRA